MDIAPGEGYEGTGAKGRQEEGRFSSVIIITSAICCA